MTHHRIYETSTSLYHFVTNFHNDLRASAPPSDVRVFKFIDGKETLVSIEQPTSYEQALEISNQHYSRKLNKRGRANDNT